MTTEVKGATVSPPSRSSLIGQIKEDVALKSQSSTAEYRRVQQLERSIISLFDRFDTLFSQYEGTVVEESYDRKERLLDFDFRARLRRQTVRYRDVIVPSIKITDEQGETLSVKIEGGFRSAVGSRDFSSEESLYAVQIFKDNGVFGTDEIHALVKPNLDKENEKCAHRYLGKQVKDEDRGMHVANMGFLLNMIGNGIDKQRAQATENAPTEN
jgi:hypothetical protein